MRQQICSLWHGRTKKASMLRKGRAMGGGPRWLCSKAEVGVFWDSNKSSVGANSEVQEEDGEREAHASCITHNIVHAHRSSSGFLGPVCIRAHGNTRSLSNNCVTQALLARSVDLQHIPVGLTLGLRLMTTTMEEAQSSRSKGPKSPPGRWQWLALILFIPGLSAFGLGCWQIMRRKWKMELLDHRRERLKEDVVPLDLATTSVRSDSKQTYSDVLQILEYRRVHCKGVFQENKSIFLGPRGRTNHGVTERGYFIITPLVPTEGNHQNVQGPVLVNRGWVPGTWRDNPIQSAVDRAGKNSDSNDQATNSKGLLTSLWGRKQQSLQKQSGMNETSVVGVVRGSENPNMFVPPNEPASGQWFFVDVPAMARAVGLPENTVYVEALQDKSLDYKGKHYPDPKDPETLIRSSVMPHDHLSYAITWFALSGATTFMAWKRLSK